MAEITPDIGHALSRPDQRRNRQQPYLISTGVLPLIVSPEMTQRSSRKDSGKKWRRTMSNEKGMTGARRTKTRSLEIGHLVIDFGFRHSLASPLAS